MSSLYVTEAGSFIKRDGGHVVVGRNNEVLFEVPLERIEDITVFDSVSITSSLVITISSSCFEASIVSSKIFNSFLAFY